MKPKHDGLLDQVSIAVSDGEVVDWQACVRQASSEREKHCLHNLWLVSEVARLARTLPIPSLSDPTAAAAPRQGVHAPAGEEATAPGRTPGATPTTGAAPALPFETWGPLKLLEHIGSGGFAAVYRAWDQRLHRQVALKLLRSDLALDPEWEARFLAEARLLARLEHSHVVRIYGIETHAGRIGIWMELVQGMSLAELVAERGTLGVGEAVRLGIDLCGALVAIHAAGIVHQDIKPHNVLRDHQGRAVLMDFGASRMRRADTGADPSGMVGTPRYMAPELFAAVPPSPQSDLYSLGLLLAYLVLGRHPAAPARGVRPGSTVVAPIRLAALRPDLPEAFSACVDRALAEDRQQRFSAAEAMLASLEQVESSLAAASDLSQESGETSRTAKTAAPSVSPSGTALPPRRRRRLAAVLALATALLLAGTYWFAHRLATPAPLSARVELTATSAGASRSLIDDAVISAQDRLELHLQLSRTAHVYVLNVDASGQAVLLFPLAGAERQNPLPARQPLVLPGEHRGERLGWSLSPDAGVEKFLVVASRDRLEAFEVEAAKIPAVALGGGLTATPMQDDAITALVRGVTGVAKIENSWASDAKPDLFALARRLEQDQRASGSIWVHELRVEKRGS